MKIKGMWLTASMLAIILGMVFLPGATYAQDETNQNFIFVNYVGQAITLDLDDVTYIVPGTDTVTDGGRFTMTLAQGWHKYAVNIPGGPGAAGEFLVEPGGAVAKAVVIEKSNPAIGPDGIVLGAPQDKAVVFDFDPLAPDVAETVPVDVWQPLAVETGQAGIVWINHSGTDELTIDMQGQLYKVSPKQGDIPGRLQTNIIPGFYRYTASLPFGGVNSEIMLTAGQVIGVNIIPGIRPAPIYDEGEKVEYPPVEMSVYHEDFTGQIATGAEVSAEEPTVMQSETAVVPAPMPAISAPGLALKNYTGDTLTFTINNQVYFVENNAETTVALLPGQYSYTASVPFAATSGMVNLVEGENVTLSIAINLNRDILSVYPN
jgi:hypothetical protein